MPVRTSISVLGAADVDAMRELLQVMAAAFDEVELYTRAPPSTAYLQSQLGRDHVLVLAARVHGRIIGGLIAYQLDKFELERAELYLYDLAVSASYRRQGVASALIERLKGIAAERGVHVIFVQADHDDPPAVALYTRLGHREEVAHFDIPVLAKLNGG